MSNVIYTTAFDERRQQIKEGKVADLRLQLVQLSEVLHFFLEQVRRDVDAGQLCCKTLELSNRISASKEGPEDVLLWLYREVSLVLRGEFDDLCHVVACVGELERRDPELRSMLTAKRAVL